MTNQSYLWLKNYPSGVDWNMDIRAEPVFFMLQKTVEKFPDYPAFDFLGKKYNWQEIYDLSCHMAKGLQDKGVEKGQRVGLFLPNCPYFIVSYFAILMTGATVVNLNPLYAEDELAHLIEDSEIDLVVTLNIGMLYDKMEKMLHATRLKNIIICSFTDVLPFPKNILFPIFKRREMACIRSEKRVIRFNDLIDNNANVVIPVIDPINDVAVLQYTGGTTGVPKGAMLTHQNIHANAVQAKAWFHQIEIGQEKMLGVLPFFHVFAMTAVMNFSVINALEIIALPRFDLKEALKVIQKKKPSVFPAVPAIYSAINNSPVREKYDLSSIRYCLSGGAPLPMQVKEKFKKITGGIVIEGYGLTESSPVVCGNLIEGVYKEGSIGMPFPRTIIEIIDAEDKVTPMPVGERGELCIRGPQVMKGYWNNPEATADALRETGDGDVRLHTGDIAIMDEDGYIFIVDRLKDMIITNGYNVYPRNVEEAIYKHPSVEECIVAGLPDPRRGEIVKAWIKLKDGRELSVEDLKEFLKEKISPMETPKRIEFRAEPLPKTMIGKLSKKDILAEEVAKS
ncbi:MAG: dicarboxylate--CoA ligase PimA [Alphaproteobacteria bacterium]|nr:MAG: dicarboxylate--CoA ligase PimA [Alphaproteobacteria bacterium]